MVGVRTVYTIELVQFIDRNVTDEKEILQIKENVGKLPEAIANTILNVHGRTDLDYVQAELDVVQYIEPEDLEEVLIE